MLALARNICTLDKAAELLQEVIIVNNASTESYEPVREFIAQQNTLPFRFIDAKENLGVARGRNFAVMQSSAPFLIMIDDDAEMGNKDCLVNLLEAFRKKTEGRPLAILSFKVLYFENREIQANAFPHKNFDKYSNQSYFQTNYYAGGAHAIRREAFFQAGKYPEDFFYGMEEYDLSYRVLDGGYAIAYTDTVVMLHKESPLGRKTKKERQYMLWQNKSKVAWRYLPSIYFATTSTLWSFEYLKTTGFDLAGWFRGWVDVLRIPFIEKRRKVSKETMRYLRKVEARLWY